MADKTEKDKKTDESSKVSTNTQQPAAQQPAAQQPAAQQPAAQQPAAQQPAAQQPAAQQPAAQQSTNPAQPPASPAQPRVGGDRVTQNDPAAQQGQDGQKGVLKTQASNRTGSQTLYEENLIGGRRRAAGQKKYDDAGRIITPDDPDYSYNAARAPRNAASEAVEKQREESKQRSRDYQERQREAHERYLKALEGFKQRAKERAEERGRIRGEWKKGNFEGMTRVDKDTWDALGKRDGGVTGSDVKDDKGKLVQDGYNPDGTPRFKQEYTRNEGSKFDASAHEREVDELNNWWMNEGGFNEYAGKLPKGVFNRDGELDLSKIKTEDQFRAIQSMMELQKSQMNERRDRAYRNLAQREVVDIYKNPNQPLRGHDRDAQRLVREGLDTTKYTPEQIAQLGRQYRIQDALKAVNDFEAPDAQPGDGGLKARQYFTEDGASTKESLIKAAQAAGLKSTEIADDTGRIDPDRIRKALAAHQKDSQNLMDSATKRVSRRDELRKRAAARMKRWETKGQNPPKGEPEAQPPLGDPGPVGEDFYQQGMEGTDIPVEEEPTLGEAGPTGEDFYQQGMEGADVPIEEAAAIPQTGSEEPVPSTPESAVPHIIKPGESFGQALRRGAKDVYNVVFNPDFDLSNATPEQRAIYESAQAVLGMGGGTRIAEIGKKLGPILRAVPRQIGRTVGKLLPNRPPQLPGPSTPRLPGPSTPRLPGPSTPPQLPVAPQTPLLPAPAGAARSTAVSAPRGLYLRQPEVNPESVISKGPNLQQAELDLGSEYLRVPRAKPRARSRRHN